MDWGWRVAGWLACRADQLGSQLHELGCVLAASDRLLLKPEIFTTLTWQWTERCHKRYRIFQYLMISLPYHQQDSDEKLKVRSQVPYPPRDKVTPVKTHGFDQRSKSQRQVTRSHLESFINSPPVKHQVMHLQRRRRVNKAFGEQSAVCENHESVPVEPFHCSDISAYGIVCMMCIIRLCSITLWKVESSSAPTMIIAVIQATMSEEDPVLDV